MSLFQIRFMLEHSENMIPWDAKKLGKKTKEGPDAPKEDPRELPWPETHPARLRKGLQEGARGPRGVPEARPSQNHWKTNEFLMMFIENMQKALFFQCKMLMGLPRTSPQEGTKNRHQESKSSTTHKREPHFPQVGSPEKRMLKIMKKWKNVFEKVSLTTVTHFRPPQGRLLEKRCLKHCK